jgi:amino acid transporter
MSESAATPEQVLVAKTELKAGALRLPEVLMQSITLVAPAIATLFSFGFIVGSFAGINAPLAFLIVTIIALMLAVNLAMLARAFPSAGGYFTYLSRAIHPRVGLFAGWLYFLINPLVPAPILVYMGTVLEGELKAKYDFTFPWWLFFILALALVMFVSYSGVSLSGKALIVLGSAEIAIVVLLSVWGLFDSGPGGFNFQPLNPSHISDVGNHAFFLAVVFGIFSITGWEGACPIAEESENPHSNVPKALIISVLVTGSILIFCTWFLLIGWGTDKVSTIATSANLPPLVLADKYWGSVYWLVLLALVNSTLAVCIASNLVGTRMWYSMGRAGALPKWFTELNPRFKTPWNAIHMQFAVILISAVILTWWWGKSNIWFVDGGMITFALGAIYILGNVAVLLYYTREKRSEFNFILHGVFPVVSSVAVAIIWWESLHPFPVAPFKWGPITTFVWAGIGVVIVAVLALMGKEEWLAAAGRAAEERPETPEELAHRPQI